MKAATDPDSKSLGMINLRVNKLRADVFFRKLKDSKEGIQIFSFDCQKNLVVPKVPDQCAYYSRQLHTYNFTIVKSTSNDKLTKGNVHIYTWNENEYSKSSYEIASAVYDCLMISNLSKTSVIRLCADGCVGQNRNSIVAYMSAHYLLNCAPRNVKKLELLFSVRGHSFLPSDKMFGFIEKTLRKIPVIYEPGAYIEVFKQHGTVSKLGEDCQVLNWKDCATAVMKKPGQ